MVVRRLDDAALETQAREIFERLRNLSPLVGPRPELWVTADPLPKGQVDTLARVTVTRRLLRLCSQTPVQFDRRPEDVRDALIAFVLAHELAHFARRDAGSFGSREASGAVEKDADEQAVGRLVVAGINLEPLQVRHLLRAIRRETPGATSTETAQARSRGVSKALADAKSRETESHFAWLLSVAGRFDQAITFYTSVASKYPYPQPMYALAKARVQFAWRRLSCDEPGLLEWLPPVRPDPRTQVEPFTIRGPGGACNEFRAQLVSATRDLAQAPDLPRAQIMLASILLMLGDAPTLDPTRSLGGATRVGLACPEPSVDPSRAFVEGDACQVSLLSQYELSARSPGSRDTAIAGLRRLLARWPTEPSLQFNLARLLAHAGQNEEAATLWTRFLAGTPAGPYRKEAVWSRSRVAPDPLPSRPATSTPVVSGASTVPFRTAALSVSTRECDAGKSWSSLSPLIDDSLTYCGQWKGELLVRNLTGVVIRSIDLTSAPAAMAEPPSEPPIYVTSDAAGEELRVWDAEAWLLDGKTPRRVVYFKRPQ
jgi:tetratricopeptide (TPR) repeat protein